MSFNTSRHIMVLSSTYNLTKIQSNYQIHQPDIRYTEYPASDKYPKLLATDSDH